MNLCQQGSELKLGSKINAQTNKKRTPDQNSSKKHHFLKDISRTLYLKGIIYCSVYCIENKDRGNKKHNKSNIRACFGIMDKGHYLV